MSVVTMPSSGGLSQSRGSDENRGRRRRASKGRNRSSQLENRRAGKSVGAASLVTPRKPLSLIDGNTRVPATTPSLKARGVLSQSTSEKKCIVGGSAVKDRAPGSRSSQRKKDVRIEDTIKCVLNDEVDTFPDIETMTRRQEPDELVTASREFVPPAYFNGLSSALKRPLLPPLPCPSSVLSSIRLEPETDLRPTTLTAVPSVECDQPYREELDLPLDLPDIDIW